MPVKKTLRTCPEGHQYYKSSDCPTCPECEKINAPCGGLLSQLSAPARRALENAGIRNEKELAAHTKKEILALHGMGPASLPILQSALKKHGLNFKV